MYVKLLSLSGVDVAEQAAWVCRNPRLIETDEERGKARKILITCLKNGHWSVLEHITASFYITGISRACSHQLVRHRIASYTQTSQRFEHNKTGDYEGFIFPEYVALQPGAMQDKYCRALEHAHKAYHELLELGMPQEDARLVLPSAYPTTLVMTANLRALDNFFSLRLCKRAQWEIRELAAEMLSQLAVEIPDFCDYLGPLCKFNSCMDCQSGENAGKESE